MTELLPVRDVAEILAARPAVLDAATLDGADTIVARVERDGLEALLDLAGRLDGRDAASPWFYDRPALQAALAAIDADIRADLEATAERIGAFAAAQRHALADLDIPVPGGRAGHTVVPVRRAGCYAPGGRYPLPSSLLMGVVTARRAGVDEVWVASPRPGPVMLAAAAIAGADGLLAFGGAHGIAALACGVGPVPPCDTIVGPGNRWVTAAKYTLAGRVGIDFLAGPSELVVLADDTADPALIAADLLAQAEHDDDALPVLVTTAPALLGPVREALAAQLAGLPTGATARRALANGGAVCCATLPDALAAVDALAPEHLQLVVADPAAVARRVRHAGALFLGERSAEVFGDYGIGPNHVLPTGGGARFTGGLSVFTFLRVRSWLALDPDAGTVDRSVRLARLEGLEGHARAALGRRRDEGTGEIR